MGCARGGCPSRRPPISPCNPRGKARPRNASAPVPFRRRPPPRRDEHGARRVRVRYETASSPSQIRPPPSALRPPPSALRPHADSAAGGAHHRRLVIAVRDPVRRISPALVSRDPGIGVRTRFPAQTCLTDRDHVDDVPGQASASAAAIMPLRKTRMPSPRRQQRIYQGPDAPCRSPRSPPVRDRTSWGQSSSEAGFSEARRCGMDVTRRPVADRPSRAGGRRSLAERLLPARGRPSAFLRETKLAAPRGRLPDAQIHLIAIGKGRPWRERRALDRRQPRWQSSSAGRPLQRPQVRDGCDATAGRGSAESCRRPEILGRWVAAGAGTAIRIFCGRRCWPHRAADCRCTDPPDRDP